MHKVFILRFHTEILLSALSLYVKIHQIFCLVIKPKSLFSNIINQILFSSQTLTFIISGNVSRKIGGKHPFTR